jgi:glycerol uptake facilitator-like aquaporin
MLSRRIAAEGLGTSLLVAAVVGSGIMAQRLADGNDAIALLANTVATGAVLLVLITLFMPISAQFNPIVTVLLGRHKGWPWLILAQIIGGITGTLIAHLMFEMPLLATATQLRTGPAQWFAEVVATFGLLFTITLGGHHRPAALPALVAGWIIAAYWFTASTSFANPAVTIARALTDSFAGIRQADVLPFILAQGFGAVAGVMSARWFIRGEQA